MITRTIKSFLILALIVQACGGRPSGSEAKNVFGEDGRVAITTDQYPWRAIGKLVNANGGTCTGTLVGKSLVLTAAHCIYSNGVLQSSSFYPNTRGNQSATSAEPYYTYAGTKDPDSDRSLDWAILVLNKNLGSSYGNLGVADNDAESMPTEIMVAGYSYDFAGGNTAGVSSCQVQNTSGGLVMHDCDMARGASGGPVLYANNNTITVVGVNVAEQRGNGESSLQVASYSDEYANFAIPTSGFMPTLRELVSKGY